MKKYQLVICFLVLLMAIGGKAATESQSVGLRDAYKSALKFNQIDNINEAKVQEASELLNQGKSNYYPKLYLKGTYTKQENLSDIHYGNLNLTHSLFKGGKDSLGVELSENSYNMAVYTKSNDRLSLYINVINAYYTFAMNENDAKNLELLAKQSNDRVIEIEKRVSIGRSRLGELLQAKAQLAQARAQLENANGLTSEAKRRFIALTGLTDSTPAIDLNSKTIEYDFTKVIDESLKRPDMKVKELKVNEAKTNLSIARRSNLPTLDLTSNYYLTERAGTTYKNTKWDVGVVFTLPLFEGFSSDSKITENVWREHEARYNYLDAKKTLELDLTSKFETHKRYVDQINSFDQALNLAKKSYDEAQKDYRLGLISNLDALTALNLYLDAKRNTEKNKIQAILSEKILEASVGNLPE